MTHLRSYMNNKRCIAFSKPNNLIMILDLENLAELDTAMRKLRAEDKYIINISPTAEGFTNLVNFQIDNSEKFLICAFANNKVGIFDSMDGKLLQQIEDLT